MNKSTPQSQFATPKVTASLVQPALLASLLSVFVSACTTVSSPIHGVIVPDGWQQTYDAFHYSPAVQAGDFLFLSGIVADLGPDPANTDAEQAYIEAFEAIGAILTEASTDWNHVTEIQTFHTDLPAQITMFAAVKDRYLTEPWPTWTAIDVDRLFPDRGLVEVQVTAYLGAPRTKKD